MVATPAEAAAYRRAQQDVVTLARAALAQWWRDLDVPDAVAASRALQGFVPELVAAYGDVAATVAADWYESLRGEAGAPGAYRAVLAEPVPVARAQAVARWSADPLFSAEPDGQHALRLLSGAVQRLVQQSGRATLLRNGDADPARPRWARAPHGKTCAFCLMLASRGAVYLTAESAGQFNQWHNDCDCQPEPVWPGQEPSYDADELYAQYLAARAEAGGETKAILAQLREDLGTN